MKLVLIDDNFAIRFLLKSFLAEYFPDFDIFSAEDGISGLGLIYAVNPDAVIIDSTLPKYSGREVIDYISSNQRLVNHKIIVITDSRNNIKKILPANFTVVDKKDPDFLKKIHILLGGEVKQDKFFVKLRNRFRKDLLKFSNKEDIIKWKMTNNLFGRVVWFIPWIGSEIINSIHLAILLLLAKNGKDANISQAEDDIKNFRVKVYPTLITLLAGIIIMLCQLSLFIVGGIVIFNNVRLESIFANYAKEIPISLENSEYDPALVEFEEGKIRLKELFVEKMVEDPPVEIIDETIVPELIQTDEQTQLPEVSPTMPEEEIPISSTVQGVSIEKISIGFSANAPSVIFNDPVQFSELKKIVANVFPLADSTSAALSGVTFQYSPDKINWYYFSSENIWEHTTGNFGSSNTLEISNQNIASLEKTIGGNQLYIKAFLLSDGNIQTSIDSIVIERELEIIYSTEEPENKEIALENPEVEIFEAQNLLDSVVSLPVSAPVDVIEPIISIEMPLPVLYQASFSAGNKVVYGKANMKVPEEELSNFTVRIYYSDGEFIGETSLINNIRNETTFLLRKENRAGGFVFAEIEYKTAEGNIIKSGKSALMENSSFTVDSTGDESDTAPGDGLCQTVSLTCTLKAAVSEANNLPSYEFIYFNIPISDPGYRDYDDPLTPSSGDSLGGDDYWTIETSGLDDLTQGALFDGKTQTLNVGDTNTDGPEVEISVSTPGVPIFTLLGADSTAIIGFALNNSHSAVWIKTSALLLTDVSIVENYLALDVKGIEFKYFDDNLTSQRPGCITYEGGTIVIDDLLIQDNIIGQPFCLRLDSPGATYSTVSNSNILGNYFGLNKLGQAGSGFGSTSATTFEDVFTLSIGDGTEAGRNVFAGIATDFDSSYLEFKSPSFSSAVSIKGNYFGFDPSGMLERSGNIQASLNMSVFILSTLNLGGSNPGDRNIFGGTSCSSCESSSIVIENTSGMVDTFSSIVIENNTLGLLADGTTSSLQAADYGLKLKGGLGQMEIRSNFFAGGVRYGIYVEDGVSDFLVKGNTFGLNTLFEDVSATVGLSDEAGIMFASTVTNVSNVTIGDWTDFFAGKNIFAGLKDGISYSGEESAILDQIDIKNNYFGTDNLGENIRSNSGSAIFLNCSGTCSNIDIGGIFLPIEGNLISNSLRGIYILNTNGSSSVMENILISSNKIGTGIDSILNFGNQRSGIVIQTTGSGNLSPINFNISSNLIRYNNIDELASFYGFGSTYGGIQLSGGLFGNGFIIDGNIISDNLGDGIVLHNYAGSIDPETPENWPIIRNNIIGFALDPWGGGFDVGGNQKNGIGTSILGVAQIYGNNIFENGNYGISNLSLSYDPNGAFTGYSHSSLLIGGSMEFSDTNCLNAQKNCISSNEWGGIYSLDIVPKNETTLYDDNFFTGGNGALGNENIVQAWNGFFELFSGNFRRTDLADSSINLVIPDTNIFHFTLDPSSRQTSLENLLQDCVTASYCPVSGTSSGLLNKTSVFANVPLGGFYSLPLLRGNFVEYIIDGSGVKTDYSTYKIDQNHIAQGETITTDGDSTSNPQINTDRGHLWTRDEIASRDFSLDSFGTNNNIELEMVDANPIWNGTNWVITVDTRTNEDNVSLSGFNDGSGVYSGGGINGISGLPNGKTSLQEALFVAEAFPNDVQIVFDPSTNPNEVFPINLLSPINQITVADSTPTLAWSSSLDPWIGTYEVYLNGVLKTTVSAGTTSYTAGELSNGSYLWKVIAKRLNGDVSFESLTGNFSIFIPPVIYPITLLSPINNAVVELPPRLDWENSLDPLISLYQIYLNGKFLKELPSSQSEYILDEDEITLGENSWQIIGINSNNEQSGMSEMQTFTFIKSEITETQDFPLINLGIDEPSTGSSGIGILSLDNVFSVSPVLIATSLSIFSGFALSGGSNQLLKGLMILGLLLPRKRKYWGLIIDLEANKPVPFATITILSLENKVSYKAISDTEGKYYIKIDENGRYKLSIKAQGYTDFETEVNISNNELMADIALAKSATFNILKRLRKIIFYLKPEILNITKLILAILVLFGFGFTISAVLTSYSLINIIFLILYGIVIIINIPTLMSMFRLKEGKLIDSLTNKGISGVIARLYDNNLNVVDVKISNKDGFVRFNSGNGVHFVNCWKNGFELNEKNNKVIKKGLLTLAEVDITNKGVFSNLYLSGISSEPEETKFGMPSTDF